MSMGGLGGKPTGLNTMNLNKMGNTQAPRLPGQQPQSMMMPGSGLRSSSGQFNPAQMSGPVAPAMPGRTTQLFNPNARSDTTAAYNARASASGIRR